MFTMFMRSLLEMIGDPNIQHWLLAVIGIACVSLMAVRLNWRAIVTPSPIVAKAYAWASLALTGAAIGMVLSTSFVALVSRSSNNPDLQLMSITLGVIGMLGIPVMLFGALYDRTPFRIRRFRVRIAKLTARHKTQ